MRYRHFYNSYSYEDDYEVRLVCIKLVFLCSKYVIVRSNSFHESMLLYKPFLFCPVVRDWAVKQVLFRKQINFEIMKIEIFLFLVEFLCWSSTENGWNDCKMAISWFCSWQVTIFLSILTANYSIIDPKLYCQHKVDSSNMLQLSRTQVPCNKPAGDVNHFVGDCLQVSPKTNHNKSQYNIYYKITNFTVSQPHVF